MTTLADMVDVLADLPLIYHPGTSWEYSLATDVVSRLVEVISGQGFDKFIQARILDPLGMVDTGFVVPQQNHESPRRLLRRRRHDGADEAGSDPNRQRARSPAPICARSHGSVAAADWFQRCLTWSR